MNNTVIRIRYLVSRAVVRPERAVSVVRTYTPFLDVVMVMAASMAWILLFALVSEMRRFLQGTATPEWIASHALRTLMGFVLALLLVALYALSVDVTSRLLGGRSRLGETLLCFLLFASIAFAIASPFVMILKVVDVGVSTTVISNSLIAVGPWLYVLVLSYVAILKIHRTVAPRAIAMMGLGLLPIVLILALLKWEFAVTVPLGLD